MEREGSMWDQNKFNTKTGDIVMIHPGGYLLKKYFNESEQIEMYKKIVNKAKGTAEEEENRKSKYKKSAWPLLYWNHPFTKEQNMEKPDEELLWANQLFDYLHHFQLESNKNTLNTDFDIDYLPPTNPDIASYGAQLYPQEGELGLHVDRGLDWGISISLGCSIISTYDSNEFLLESGDVFVGRFGKILHSVKNTLVSTVPSWWSDSHPGIDTFGSKVRCNIQLRQNHHCGSVTTKEQFKLFLHDLAINIERGDEPFKDFYTDD
eukprot:TRINITY_DN23982_c0_g1_i1.p1 TRINITY_DN23982_c0_g1~~TRINITY_DN23982_c0_g1_i1.p1  ORF type:complete len:264 (-),score=44.07 TRINITY_DN23982_c0_g1_i1:1-792(-)